MELSPKSPTRRPLKKIAEDIREHWPRISEYALPYLDAMSTLWWMHDSYFQDSAEEIVCRFLLNARGWRGEHAKRLKAELNLALVRHRGIDR